jgi:hypothetical protein
MFALFGVQPHSAKSFSFPPIRYSSTRLGTVGLCLDPPDKALVLCVDEKNHVQALERTQPVSGKSA